MKKGIILAAGMIFLLTACSKDTTGDVAKITPQEIKDVILNDAAFISTEENCEETRLSEFDFFNGEVQKDILETGRYVIVDLDNDGYNEVILEVYADTPEPQLEVFRLEEGQVYGYQFPYRAMQWISADGVIEGSSGAAYNDTYRLSFDKAEYEEIILANDRDGSYYIDGKEAEWNEYNDFIDDTFKQKAEWQEDYSKLK